MDITVKRQSFIGLNIHYIYIYIYMKNLMGKGITDLPMSLLQGISRTELLGEKGPTFTA